MPYCTSCGTEVGQNDGFCQDCGAQLGDRTESDPVATDGVGHRTEATKATPSQPIEAAHVEGLDTDVLPRRVGAVLVDTVLVTIILSVLLLFLGWTGVDAPFILGFLFLVPAYFSVAEVAMNGRTPGKALFGLRVVSLAEHPLTGPQVLIRNVLRLVDGFFNYLIGLLIIAFTKQNQRLGDLAAKTTVVRDP